MPGIVIHEYKVVYWYIPKNACTSFKTLFAELIGLKYNGLVHDAEFEITNDFNSHSDYFHFSIVRHPLMRLYSLYKDKILLYPITDWQYLNGVQKIVFMDHMEKFWAGMSFNDFCKSVSSINYNVADPHYGPQFLQIPPTNIYLMKFENIKEEASKIFKLLGIQGDLYNKNKAEYSDQWNNQLDSVVSFNAIGAYYFEDFKRFNYE